MWFKLMIKDIESISDSVIPGCKWIAVCPNIRDPQPKKS